MSEEPSKKSWLASLSPMTRNMLGIGIIAVIVVLGVIYGPHYNSDDSTTTGDAPPSTVTVTSPQGALKVNRSLVYQGVTVTVTSVEQAHAFSDDGKSAYAHVSYIVRVYIHVMAPATLQRPVGIDFGNQANLVLPDGTQLIAHLSQISPDVLPGTQQDGFLDFWVNSPLHLSSLTFMLNGSALVLG